MKNKYNRRIYCCDKDGSWVSIKTLTKPSTPLQLRKIRKIYVTHSSNFDYRTALYYPLRNSHLNKKYQIIFPHEKNNKLTDSKETISNCDVVIAEISHSSTGQGIELGWAAIFKVPIICVYKQGSKYSKSLSLLTDIFISYKDEQDMIRKLKTALETR